MCEIWHKVTLVLPRPPATPKIWDFQNFTIQPSKQSDCHSNSLLNMVIAKSLHNNQSLLSQIWHKKIMAFPRPPAMPKIWDFRNFTIQPSKQTILTAYKTWL